MSFRDLGLSEATLKAVEEAGYIKPTDIQAQTIPAILMCRDVLGLAQTGTGKTASFTLPMIDILANGKAKARMPRSLILAPTRELAAQVSESFDKYGKNNKLSQALIVGGTSMDEQIKKLDHGVDVLIATPGRLLDLFARGKVILADIKVLVIDEADRMLDMGFRPDLEKIVSIVPPLRQTLFFSATMSDDIKSLTDKFLSNPKTIQIDKDASTAVNVEHYIVNITHWKQKQGAFYKVFSSENVSNAFVFCNRKKDIGDVCKFLSSKNITNIALHGDMSQEERTKSLSDFKAGKAQILVCSDVAARGIDIQGMSHVFNWDIPNNPEDYVHRIGRTGRAGAKGRAFSIAMKNEDKNLDKIKKFINSDIKVFEFEEMKKEEPVEVKPRAVQPNRDRKQDKSRKKPYVPVDFTEDENNDGGFGDDIPAFLLR